MTPLQSGLDNDQASTRREATLYDQHISAKFPKGRPWHASVDKKSGFPVGLISPKGWSAPWLPEQTWFRFSEDEPNRFTIDYQGILNERLEAHTEYAQEYDSKAVSKGWDPADETKRENIEKVVGPKPLPIEPVAAAMQGNSWVLGLTQDVDPRVAPFLAKTDRRTKILAAMPDFSDTVTAIETDVPSEEDDLDKLLDWEEEVDPEAVGGKKVPVKQTRKPKAA